MKKIIITVVIVIAFISLIVIGVLYYIGNSFGNSWI